MAQKAFISYSHSDREFVSKLSNTLIRQGVDVWIDKWDIRPGDSIVRKIYEEGLANAKLFLIVLSAASVSSDWVKDELDVATVRRIGKVTRVVPVLKETCEIPTSLRALMWIDLRKDFDAGVKEIVDVYFDVNSRPAVSAAPEFVTKLRRDVPGLTGRASAVATFIASDQQAERALRAYDGATVAEGTRMSPDDINDAMDELREQGLVKTLNWFGTAPYHFGQAEPTYALFLRMKELLPYDPEKDIVTVVAAIAALKKTNGVGLAEATSLPTTRLNLAMEYVQDYGLAQVVNFLGTTPYHFGDVFATRHTRDFVAAHAS